MVLGLVLTTRHLWNFVFIYIIHKPVGILFVYLEFPEEPFKYIVCGIVPLPVPTVNKRVHAELAVIVFQEYANCRVLNLLFKKDLSLGTGTELF